MKTQLAAALHIPPLAARLLANRGITSIEAAREFLTPSLQRLHDPFLMRGMAEAVQRLTRGLQHQESIVIYGDYDVDGITATAVLSWFFRDIGVPVPYYLPHRMREGYGLNAEAVRKLADQGTRVLITVDCGITGHQEVQLARRLGMDVIVTDHHQVPPTLPDAVAVLNPHQSECGYPAKELAGVGVAFKLVMALRGRLRQEGRFAGKTPNLRRHLDLVALGTIADIAPLQGENRILVKHGLQELTHSQKLGVQTLKHVTHLAEQNIGPRQVGFTLAPRLNAAGRLAAAQAGVELLLSEDAEQAEKLALYLDCGESGAPVGPGANLCRSQSGRRGRRWGRWPLGHRPCLGALASRGGGNRRLQTGRGVRSADGAHRPRGRHRQGIGPEYCCLPSVQCTAWPAGSSSLGSAAMSMPPGFAFIASKYLASRRP